MMDWITVLARRRLPRAPWRFAVVAFLVATFLGSAVLAGAAPPGPVDTQGGARSAPSPVVGPPTPLATPATGTATSAPGGAVLKVGDRALVAGTGGSGLRIRAAPIAGAAILGQAPEGASVTITDGPRGEWYGITYGPVAGWANGAYLRPANGTNGGAGAVPTGAAPATGTATSGAPAAGGAGGALIASTALQYLGTPYVWGGASPNGWDCSGFVVYIYRMVTGRTLPRTSQAQWTVGTPVAREAIQAGDLVFFQNTYAAGITHVGIALGDGRFVHASAPRVGTIISNLGESYYVAHYAGARRP